MIETMRGTIKSLKPGFGFLKMQDGTDVFFLPKMLADGVRFDDLQEGRDVEADFDRAGGKGPRAERVRVL
jgi:cold shock CspA family protein